MFIMDTTCLCLCIIIRRYDLKGDVFFGFGSRDLLRVHVALLIRAAALSEARSWSISVCSTLFNNLSHDPQHNFQPVHPMIAHSFLTHSLVHWLLNS